MAPREVPAIRLDSAFHLVEAGTVTLQPSQESTRTQWAYEDPVELLKC